jgi:cytochrome c-type biogenesis protein CcmH
MTTFVALAAALTLLTAAGVAVGLLRAPRAQAPASDDVNAAVYRDQMAELDTALREGMLAPEAHARARDAIRTRLARELSTAASVGAFPAGGWMPIASVLFVCAAAPVLYAMLGNPAALSVPPAAAAVARDAGHALQGTPMAERVERLARRLEKNAEDVEGWIMLARSYSATGRFDAAAAAFAEASQRAPSDANILADRADVLAMAAGRRFDGEPDAIIARTLKIDPAHRKALALAGTSAFARRDYAAAAMHWTRLREQLPADSEAATRVDASIAQARALAGGATAPAAAKDAAITGTVSLAPALARRVAAGDTLFIYARATQGPRIPVAVIRRPVGAWPVSFRLDDRHALSASSRLSTMADVMLEARISRNGAALPAAGDLRAIKGPVPVGAQGVALSIDGVVE